MFNRKPYCMDSKSASRQGLEDGALLNCAHVMPWIKKYRQEPRMILSSATSEYLDNCNLGRREDEFWVEYLRRRFEEEGIEGQKEDNNKGHNDYRFLHPSKGIRNIFTLLNHKNNHIIEGVIIEFSLSRILNSDPLTSPRYKLKFYKFNDEKNISCVDENTDHSFYLLYNSPTSYLILQFNQEKDNHRAKLNLGSLRKYHRYQVYPEQQVTNDIIEFAKQYLK